MAQFYTLEEAARVLGMSPEELKNKAQSREVRAFVDGGTWQFRVVDIDELARRRGLGSDAELSLSDLETGSSGSSEIQDLDLSEFHLGAAKPDLGTSTDHGRGKSGADTGSDHDILLDDLSVPPAPVTGSSSVIIGSTPAGKHPSDSDVRLVPDTLKSSSDSDVQLASAHRTTKHASDSDVTLIKEDTADHGLITAPSGSDTSVRHSPTLGSSAEVQAASSSSADIELNPSSELIDALTPDSGSDFELSALDASDEFDTAAPSKPSDSDVTASDPKFAGINLSRPSDSGINLQTGGFGSADSIELAPLSDDDIKTPAKTSAKPAKPKPSLAATPPPAVQKGGKDIFDDTDFEVDLPSDADSSDDKTVQLEAASDFDLEESDTGSEVFAIDEEGVDQNAATAMAPSSFSEEEDEEDDGFESAVSSEMSSAWASSDTSAPAERATPAVMLSREAEVEWGGLVIGALGVATVLLFFAAFVAHDLVRNMYEFQEGGAVGSGIVHAIAGMFGG